LSQSLGVLIRSVPKRRSHAFSQGRRPQHFDRISPGKKPLHENRVFTHGSSDQRALTSVFHPLICGKWCFFQYSFQRIAHIEL